MDITATLRSKKLSVTPVRVTIIEILTHHPHCDAAKLFELVKAKITTTSIQAVYQNLNLLVSKGMVREIKPKGMPSLYETRVGDNHHHLICRSCRKISDTGCLDTAPCLTAIDPKGFIIDEAEIVFWGLCPDCYPSPNTSRTL